MTWPRTQERVGPLSDELSDKLLCRAALRQLDRDEWPIRADLPPEWLGEHRATVQKTAPRATGWSFGTVVVFIPGQRLQHRELTA